ncbi:MAG: cyclic nucleotide-binding domain-containing protein [Desulfatitalea sp.]|nr:cyclic nucleotide-binding domain-containing protein [Desulfatitalea sp.]NNK01467.1 cyclic nucleotide-binding domain-containing protein [Desulfatitalea sp.]
MPNVDQLNNSIDIIDKIKTLPALASFDEKDIKELLRISKIVRYRPGDLIVDEANYDGWIYYLINGRVRIAKNDNELATLYRTGDVFGEVGGMGSGALSVSVSALDETVCLKIDLSNVDGLPNENRFVFRYAIFRGFAEVMAKRLRITTEKYLQTKEELERLRKQMDDRQ